MEVLGGQLCKREEELGRGSFLSDSAHQLFDEMSSPLEMFEEDVLLVMYDEKITWDEAVHLLLEELRDAQHRMHEKLDRLMEMLDSTETSRRKTCEEMNTPIVRATTIVLKAASQPPQASSCSAPTKCSMVGLDNNSGTDQPLIVFKTMRGVSRGVPAAIQLVVDFSPRPIVDIKLDKSMLTRCLMKFPWHDNKVLMVANFLEVNPRPPPSRADCKVSCAEQQLEPWPFSMVQSK